MAAGSQAENGNCALLVQAPRVIRNNTSIATSENLCSQIKKFHDLNEEKYNKLTKNKTSPTRFLRAVSIPALKDFVFSK